MTYVEPALTTPRRIPRILVAGPPVVVATTGAPLGSPLPASSSSTAASPSAVLRGTQRGARGAAARPVPDGPPVFAAKIPGVADLDPALRGALRPAAPDAADDGVAFAVHEFRRWHK